MYVCTKRLPPLFASVTLGGDGATFKDAPRPPLSAKLQLHVEIDNHIDLYTLSRVKENYYFMQGRVNILTSKMVSSSSACIHLKKSGNIRLK